MKRARHFPNIFDRLSASGISAPLEVSGSRHRFWGIAAQVIFVLYQVPLAFAVPTGQKPKARITMEDTSAQPRIAKKWQEAFLDVMQKDPRKIVRGWAMFSYGGWSDQGQIMIFEAGDGSFFVNTVPAGSRKLDPERVVKKSDLSQIFDLAAEWQKLGDWQSDVMDGIQFEYVVAERKGEKPVVSKRVFMNNPHLSPIAAGHQNLVSTFQKLLTQQRGEP